jgi:hypothetical protein
MELLLNVDVVVEYSTEAVPVVVVVVIVVVVVVVVVVAAVVVAAVVVNIEGVVEYTEEEAPAGPNCAAMLA